MSSALQWHVMVSEAGIADSYTGPELRLRFNEITRGEEVRGALMSALTYHTEPSFDWCKSTLPLPDYLVTPLWIRCKPVAMPAHFRPSHDPYWFQRERLP